MPLRPRRMHEGRSRALLGAVTVVVLLVQTAPAASGLLASFLHGTFHLTSRTGLEHLESAVAARPSGELHHSHGPGEEAHHPVRPSPELHTHTHTHGPGQAPHSHAPVVDAVLEIAATSDGPAVGPTATLDRSAERYLRPDRPDLEPVRSVITVGSPVPDAPTSLLAPDPPVPPPRA